MRKWAWEWWARNSLVDRLSELGPSHPLVARLEARGWEGLAKDLQAREVVRTQFANAHGAYPVETCPACQGQGEGCPWCEGYGYTRLGPEPTSDISGVGAVYRHLRDAGWPRAYARQEAWRRWYKEAFGKKEEA